MKKYILLPILVAVLSSCALNGLFLFPYPLKETSEFKQFDEDVNDTLHLVFDGNRQPKFAYLGGNDYQPGYTIKSVDFPSEDRMLNGWIMRPDSSNGISIFFTHGNAGNVVYQYQLMEPLVERGYTVFLWDYSEFGFSSGKATRKNVYKDAHVALDYFKANCVESTNKIVLYGQSLGGHLAAVIGTERQNDIDAVVIEGAFNSHKDIAADRVPFLGRIFVAEQYSGKKTIADLKKPLLVIHSVRDQTIDYQYGVDLYKHATAPKTFYAIDSAHIRGPLYYADSISSRIQRMLY